MEGSQGSREGYMEVRKHCFLVFFIKNTILSAFTSDTHVFKNHQFEFSRGAREVKKSTN